MEINQIEDDGTPQNDLPMLRIIVDGLNTIILVEDLRIELRTTDLLKAIHDQVELPPKLFHYLHLSTHNLTPLENINAA